jgi:hypothetical protein
MLEQPPQTGGPAFRIPGSADRVVSEANAEDSSGNPVSDGMATKIEEDPSRDHGDDGCCGRVCRPSRTQGQACGCEPANLHRIPSKNRKAAKDFAFRRQGQPIFRQDTSAVGVKEFSAAQVSLSPKAGNPP